MPNAFAAFVEWIEPFDEEEHPLVPLERYYLGGENSVRGFEFRVFFFVMVVAAAEVVVGLAIIMAIFRARRSASVDDANLLKL